MSNRIFRTFKNSAPRVAPAAPRSFQDRVNTANVKARLERQRQVVHWAVDTLNTLKVQRPTGDSAEDEATNKRINICTGSYLVAIEHAMSIGVLIEEGMHGSGLALVRPALEAWLRGFWLATTASTEDVDGAGRDVFPGFTKLTNAVEKPGALPDGALSHLRGDMWRRLCSYTHGGYQQIGARLTPDGFGYAFSEDEILSALIFAEWILLIAVANLTPMCGRDDLAKQALAVMGGGIVPRAA